jgi:Ribonuclease HepT-like
MLRDAVERNSERISEASRHIPEHLKTRHSEIPWPKVAGIGNILRHAYPIVDDSMVWEVVARDLPPPQSHHRAVAAGRWNRRQPGEILQTLMREEEAAPSPTTCPRRYNPDEHPET